MSNEPKPSGKTITFNSSALQIIVHNSFVQFIVHVQLMPHTNFLINETNSKHHRERR